MEVQFDLGDRFMTRKEVITIITDTLSCSTRYAEGIYQDQFRRHFAYRTQVRGYVKDVKGHIVRDRTGNPRRELRGSMWRARRSDIERELRALIAAEDRP